MWWRSKPPIDETERTWIEESMSWCAREFGPAPLARPVVVPTEMFFPGAYSGTRSEIRKVLDRVAGFMGADASRIDLVFFTEDEPQLPEAAQSSLDGTAGHYSVVDGRPVIGLNETDARSPLALVATLAHELAHDRLIGEGRISPDRADGEPLTDLATVYLGLGVFTANTAFDFSQDTEKWRARRQGYLTEPMFGYALARYAMLRGETKPSWAAHLDINPRTYLRKSLRFMRTTR